MFEKPGGVFVRRADELSEEDRVLFQTVARIVFTDTSETLLEQMDRRGSLKRVPDNLKPLKRPTAETVHPLSARERIFYNGFGGFTPDGHEYIITLEPGQNTPAPWGNVIASPHIGTVVSESGSAYTRVETPLIPVTTWHNDPLCDSSGGVRHSGRGTAHSGRRHPCLPVGGPGTSVGMASGILYSNMGAGISSELFTYVAMDASVKFAITLRNTSKCRVKYH